MLTTHAKALTSATPGDLVPGADGVREYLVTMRGHFTAYGSSRPPGAALPTGEYLSLVVDAATFQVLDFGLSPAPPRVPPASLGPVTLLTGRGRLPWPRRREAPGIAVTRGDPLLRWLGPATLDR